MTETTPRQLYDTQLDEIASVIGWICRRHALRGDEAEDFTSWVHVRLLEDDCAVFARFRRACKLSTYLTTVVNNLFKDFLIAKNSKWRPSARAKALGWQAVALEAEIVRHGRSTRDAIQLVRQNPENDLSEEELENLVAQLPPRTRRTFVDESTLDQAASTSRSDGPALSRQARSEGNRVERELAAALATLTPQDALILKMRFQEGHKLVTIAKVLGLSNKGIYPHVERLLKKLQAELLARGVTWPRVADVFDAGLDLEYPTE